MQVSVESPSKLERRVSISVPFEQLDAAFENQIQKAAKNAKMKGFRPGNVPMSHVKQMYGDTARQQALSEVIQKSLYAALQQEKLNPITTPRIEPKSMEPGKPLEFIASFEVLPEFDSIEFKAKEIEKLISSIKEDDVNKVIERLSEQYTQWRVVERAAKEKDQVIMDFRGSIDGKVFPGGEAHDYPIVIGSNTMIPGFEEGVIGIKAKEERTITVTFPAEYFAKEVAGKKAEFIVTAHKVSEPEAPAMDAELIKKFGVKSGDLEELRAEIRKNLEREVERLTGTKMKAKVFDLLIAQNHIDIPKALVDQEAKRIHDEVHPHHGQEHHHSAEENAEFQKAGERNVILGLLIGEYVKQHNLLPEKSRVDAHIQKLAASYENPAEVVQWYTSDKRRLAEVEMLVLEEQVIDKLLEGITVKEKTVPYADLIKS